MDQETAHYIISYYKHLLSDQEKLALRHLRSLVKLGAETGEDYSKRRKIYEEVGWLSKDETVLDLLQNEPYEFEKRVASRIMNDHPKEVFLNKCPNCNKLARTTKARQCRYCGDDWHNN